MWITIAKEKKILSQKLTSLNKKSPRITAHLTPWVPSNVHRPTWEQILDGCVCQNKPGLTECSFSDSQIDLCKIDKINV